MQIQQQQKKSFTSADVAYVCLRSRSVAQKWTKRRERKKRDPAAHAGGIASRWPCKGIVVPLRVRSCFECEVKACRRSVTGFDPYCQMLLGSDLERLPGRDGPARRKPMWNGLWVLAAPRVHGCPEQVRGGTYLHVWGHRKGNDRRSGRSPYPPERSVFQSRQYIQSSQRRGPRPRAMLKALDFWKVFGCRIQNEKKTWRKTIPMQCREVSSQSLL